METPQPIELTLAAQEIETPVLKYQLLPAETELKPGNAVPILLRLPWEQSSWMNKVYPELREWVSRPLSAFGMDGTVCSARELLQRNETGSTSPGRGLGVSD